MWHRLLILSCLCFFSLAGCKEIPGLIKHNIDLNGVGHGKKLYKEAKDCTACHGVNLKGQAYIPGCYNCHGVMWNNKDHTVDISGRKHKTGYIDAVTNCSGCHGGTSLKKENIHGRKDDTHGRHRPGCYDCHGDLWSAVTANHTIARGGKLHGSKLFKPFDAANCVTCHGADLKGSNNRPSCYSCHGAKWESVTTTHVVSKTGTSGTGVMHSAGLFTPASNCVSCHGADLKGSEIGPSCYSCHQDAWAAFGTSHTVSKGNKMHGAGLNTPTDATSGCMTCHGTDLKGVTGSGTSCYSCHTAKWRINELPHTKNKDGAMHGQAYKTPVGVCDVCHGANLRGDPLVGQSCFNCHGDKWTNGG